MELEPYCVIEMREPLPINTKMIHYIKSIYINNLMHQPPPLLIFPSINLT